VWKTRRRLGLLGLLFGLGLFLAACNTGTTGDGGGGGGGGGGDGGGTAVTVTVTAPGATAAAYQVGSGSWQTASDPESFTFEVPGGGAYQVAVYCGGSGDPVLLFSLTTDELTALADLCGGGGDGGGTVSFTVNYTVTGVSGAAGVVLYHKAGTAFGLGPAGTISVTNGVAGEQDLVLVVYDGSQNPLAAKLKTVTVSTGGSYAINVTGADAIGLKNFDFTGAVPSGWPQAGYGVISWTARGTGVPAGGGMGASGPYADFPFAERTAFLAYAADDVGTPTDYLAFAKSVAGNDAPAVTFLGPINPSAAAASGALLEVSGLTLPDGLLGYRIELGDVPTPIHAQVSAGYLGNATSYTVPDLSGLGGFPPPPTGTVTVRVELIVSNRTLGELLDAHRRDEQNFWSLIEGLELRVAGHRITVSLP